MDTCVASARPALSTPERTTQRSGVARSTGEVAEAGSLSDKECIGCASARTEGVGCRDLPRTPTHCKFMEEHSRDVRRAAAATRAHHRRMRLGHEELTSLENSSGRVGGYSPPVRDLQTDDVRGALEIISAP
eukprot:8706986-Pyramimonas_sp.AAC.1